MGFGGWRGVGSQVGFIQTQLAAKLVVLRSPEKCKLLTEA